MKAVKLIASLAVGLCVFTAVAARAQQVTNTVNINILLIPQGPTQTVDGTNTLYVPEKSSSLNTAGFVHEIGRALNTEKGVTLTSAAKLVLLTGGGRPSLFAIVDGTNFYAITNIMTLTAPFTTTFTSGTQNGGTELAFPTMKTVQIAQLNYSDVSIVGGDGLQFILQGLEISSTADTAPVTGSGVYSETVNVKVTDLLGEIALSDTLYFASGSMSYSGKGNLVWK